MGTDIPIFSIGIKRTAGLKPTKRTGTKVFKKKQETSRVFNDTPPCRTPSDKSEEIKRDMQFAHPSYVMNLQLTAN